MQKTNSRKVVVKYSGGLDSTLVADKMAREYDQVYLLTYIVPTQYGVKRSKINAKKLKENFPGKITHEIIDIRKDVSKIRGNAFEVLYDCVKYKFCKPFCLGCKVSMHMHSIVYCLKHNISNVADGNNYAEATHAFEQRETSIKYFKKLYEKYGINYFNPIYNINDTSSKKRVSKILDMLCLVNNREATKKELRKKKYILGKPIGDMHRSIQPQCWANPMFGILSIFAKNSSIGIKKYIQKKITFIDEKIKKMVL